MPGVIALFGPTGVGKTAVAVALARRLRRRGERPVAVSADALQVYEGLEVLTGAPSPAERVELEHRLVGFLPVDATFSAGQYAALAHAEIDALLGDGARPIVVGGTGLYLRAALADLALAPAVAPEVRDRWMARLEAEGVGALHADLARRAPAAAARIDPHDRHRVVRALELHELGQLAEDRGELWTEATRHPTVLIGLVAERQALYRAIDERVEAMVRAGAVEEVRSAHAAGASATARGALGFQELLAGDVEAMKRRTRNYARRQLTWLRKLAGVRVIDVTGRPSGDVAAEIDMIAGP